MKETVECKGRRTCERGCTHLGQHEHGEACSLPCDVFGLLCEPVEMIDVRVLESLNGDLVLDIPPLYPVGTRIEWHDRYPSPGKWRPGVIIDNRRVPSDISFRVDVDTASSRFVSRENYHLIRPEEKPTLYRCEDAAECDWDDCMGRTGHPHVTSGPGPLTCPSQNGHPKDCIPVPEEQTADCAHLALRGTCSGSGMPCVTVKGGLTCQKLLGEVQPGGFVMSGSMEQIQRFLAGLTEKTFAELMEAASAERHQSVSETVLHGTGHLVGTAKPDTMTASVYESSVRAIIRAECPAGNPMFMIPLDAADRATARIMASTGLTQPYSQNLPVVR